MNRKQSGIALITTLSMLAILATIMGLLMVMTTSDLRQSRASVQQLQARAVAEAGEVYARYAATTAAQDDIRDTLRAMMLVNVDPATQWAIPQGSWATARNSIQGLLNSGYSSLPATELSDLGSAAITYTLTNFRGGTRSASAQAYFVDYTVVSTGTANGAIRRVEDKGYFEIEIGKPSLSQYLFLVEDAGGSGGFFPTGSRFNGPVHANQNWGFWGAPEFTDTITTASNTAWFWDLAGSCGGGQKVEVAGDSRPPCTVPVFAKGFTRNAPEVELPTSFLSQRRAALGLDAESTDPVTAVELCTLLDVRPNCNSNSYVPNDVYIVNDGTNITGGLYVQGNLDVLEMDGSARNGTQTYTFEQGTQIVTVLVDYNLNTTTVTRSGSGPTTTESYTGIPNGQAPLGAGGPTGQVYVEGRIDDLRAPARTGTVGSNPPDHPPPSQIPPALALETELSVAATGRIDLRSDLVYECDPTQVAEPDYITDFPRCALDPDELLPTVLGVLSLNADVRITTDTPNDLYLWGSYLAGTSGGGLSVQNYNSRGPQGTLRLFGGVIQSEDQLRGTVYSNGNLAHGYMETFDYDRRFSHGAVAPPNFPTVRTFDVQNVIPVKLTFREY